MHSRTTVNRLRIFLIFLLPSLAVVPPVSAATELSFWHGYQHAPSGVLHYAFDLTNVKRGLFFGSCGPSTRSLRWRFSFDLAGSGPTYRPNDVTLRGDDLRELTVVDGTINLDADQRNATINLQVEHDGIRQDFIGNGRYRIRPIK